MLILSVANFICLPSSFGWLVEYSNGCGYTWCDYSLNLTATELGSVEVRGRRVVWMTVPLDLASGGRKVKKRRAGLAQAEKGLNLAVTSVMNFVIMLGNWLRRNWWLLERTNGWRVW